MDEDQNALAEQISGDDEDVENGGVGTGDAEEFGASDDQQGMEGENVTSSVQKRIHAQAKKHAREIRQLHERISHMQSQGSDSANPEASMYQEQSSYSSPGQPNPPAMSEEERIHKAVRFALGAKEHEERQAKDAESQAHVHKQYQRLNDEFDNASEKYEDFDEVVRGNDVPFTPHVRDALLLVKNPADVAYKLGKNKSELERISKLHPLEQAKEVINLGTALLSGQDGKSSSSSKSNPLGSVRANPAHSSTAVTGKTPPSEIRRRMKAGTWK